MCFVVYGAFGPKIDVRPQAYRSNGVPEGVGLTRHREGEHPDLPASFRQGSLVKDLKEQPALARAVGSAREVVLVNGAVADPSSLDYLRDVVGVVTGLLNAGGVGVLDRQAANWWEPEAWRAQVYTPHPFRTHELVSVVVAPDVDADMDGLLWVHTQGLLTFGRPEVPQTYAQNLE